MLPIIIKLALSIVSLLLLTLIQSAIYSNKNDKARLMPLTIVAPVYVVAATFLIIRFHDLLVSFLSEYDLQWSVIIASNMLLIIGFLLIKLIAGGIIKSAVKEQETIQLLSGSVYEFDDLYSNWFLQYKWTGFRSFLNYIKWFVAVAAAVMLFFLNAEVEDLPAAWTFPCIIPILITEVFCYFNGQTKEEYGHDIQGIEADSRRAGNYFRVREILENILPEPLLASFTGFELAGRNTPADFIKKLSKSEDKIDRLTADYFFADDRYMKAELDGVQATLDLMHGRNVVYHNPFYRDLDMYITLPLFNALISGQKVVVVTGRMTVKDDVHKWLEQVLSDYTHMPSLWQVEDLTQMRATAEIGVLSFSDIYDPGVISNNTDFFAKTELVILIEPSAILSTGQIALSILSREIEQGEKEPVYFVCDRMVDGLVDTISHLLRAEFTDVVASPVPRCVYTGMTWNANGDYCRQQLFSKQTRYLGNGIELAAVAVKNQIPHATWYGESKVPIKDIKWIAGQNYPVICQYMNQPSQQSTLYEKIGFVSNLWSSSQQDEQFAIVEDEFNNMFATLRTFLSRGRQQSFVNVMSENYLLRDYMRCNPLMFISDPNVVASIVPDYAKTERNTLLKLVLIMTRHSLTAQEILDEFHLVGIDSDSAYDLLDSSLRRYTSASADIITVETIEKETDGLAVEISERYSITKEMFRKYFEKTLAEAFFIVEDEEDNNDFVDARFFSHVTQMLLPGQLVTYDGKYYRAQHISPNAGVVLRRASDLFDDRRYYRQLRKYTLSGDEKILSNRKVEDIEFAFIQKNISVTTDGYLDLPDVHDLRRARTVDLTNDPLKDNYSRKFINKTIFRVRLPETDEDMRFTFCLLLSETLRSVFPDGWPYIAVTTPYSDEKKGVLNAMVYPVSGEVGDYIYIIEDSDIDMGLMEAIERNWDRLMDTLGDFISWHFEKMREPEVQDPVQPSYEYAQEQEQEKKSGWLARMFQRILQLMPGSQEGEEKVELDYDEEKVDREAAEKEAAEKEAAEKEEAGKEASEKAKSAGEEDEEPADVINEPAAVAPSGNTGPEEKPEEAAPENGPSGEQASAEKASDDQEPADKHEADHEIAEDDGTDIFDESGDADDDMLFELEFAAQGLMPLPKTRYRRECFLKFGFEDIDKRLKLDELLKYMRVHGWTNNSITHARKRDLFADTYLDTNAVNRCDFCGKPLSGASYELMNDGRIRCNDCSASAITSVEEFRDLFYQSMELMEAFYGIKYRVPINVRTADAKTVARGVGSIFRPSTEYAARVLGYAQRERKDKNKNKDKYNLVIENGCPRVVALETMTHEMTHIWQYLNWDENEFNRAFNMGDPTLNAIANDIVYEGMAVWSATQYLYQIGETRYASETEYYSANRNDVYGLGFVLFREQYPLVKDGSLIKVTPFASFPPIDPARVKEVIMSILSQMK